MIPISNKILLILDINFKKKKKKNDPSTSIESVQPEISISREWNGSVNQERTVSFQKEKKKREKQELFLIGELATNLTMNRPSWYNNSLNHGVKS